MHIRNALLLISFSLAALTGCNQAQEVKVVPKQQEKVDIQQTTELSEADMKQAVKKAYQFANAIRKMADTYHWETGSGNEPVWDTFYQEMTPYFTDNYLNTRVKPDFKELFVPTEITHPTDFALDEYFLVKEKKEDTFTIETAELANEMYDATVYTITAKKVDGEWKIDQLEGSQQDVTLTEEQIQSYYKVRKPMMQYLGKVTDPAVLADYEQKELFAFVNAGETGKKELLLAQPDGLLLGDYEGKHEKALVQSGFLKAPLNAIKPAASSENGLYTFQMKATDGSSHTVHIYADNETVRVSDTPWAGENEGDTIYEGNYRVALEQNGAKVKPVDIGEWQFNVNRDVTKVLGGKPDLLMVARAESSNANGTRLFFVHNGALIPVTIGGETYLYATGSPVNLGDGKFMLANYSNADGMWTFVTYAVDAATGNAAEVSSKSLSLEEGNAFYQANFQ